MKTIWNSSDHTEMKNRIARLTPDARPRWGRMSAPQMVVHLTDALRMASGELAIAPKKVWLRHSPLKQLIIYWLPWPKGVPTMEQLLSRVAGEWPAEVAALQSTLDDLVRRGPANAAPAHPAFGRLTGRTWGVLVYRHLDHHLRQFGV
jgi:hypothetical protein